MVYTWLPSKAKGKGGALGSMKSQVEVSKAKGKGGALGSMKSQVKVRQGKRDPQGDLTAYSTLWLRATGYDTNVTAIRTVTPIPTSSSNPISQCLGATLHSVRQPQQCNLSGRSTEAAAATAAVRLAQLRACNEARDEAIPRRTLIHRHTKAERAARRQCKTFTLLSFRMRSRESKLRWREKHDPDLRVYDQNSD